MRLIIYIFSFLLLQNAVAQHAHVEFKENKGQWENNVLFKAKLPGGQLYLEQNKLTYQFYNETDIVRIGDLHHGWIKNPQATDSIINLHAFEVQFLNAQIPFTRAQHPCADYENYFIGNDSTKWASNVKKYQDVTYQNLYQGIDLKLYSANDNGFKYDFIVAPNADANQIKLQYNGQNNLSINKEGQLMVTTSVNTLVEQKPYAYQLINGKEKEVKCNFKLEGNTLSFEFPKGYDKTLPLIIDPALIFASYSGSTIDNWGFTSTFDQAGSLFGGGVAFGLGYPTTLGAFQITYNGGYTDVSITKFNKFGTDLIYSTYIGGSSRDNPHSLIVNHNNELVVFGTTQSINFPTTSSYDFTPNGGYDIFVAKFGVNGNVLLGSTYVGGTSDDGMNYGNPLKYNYADEYRGEVVVDANNYVYVASTTRSTDFPTTTGVINPTFIAGDLGQNACVFKLSPDLTNLEWSTYFGGSMDDAAYSLQFDELGNLLFTGGTKSPDLPVSTTAFKPTLGGVMDGYITKITPDASTILACTYVGTDSLDQTFFVQLDTANNVYVLGQTEGVYPITPIGVHADSNSGQFLHKLTPNLDSTVFSTVFGTGSGHVDIAPSAFLVNECNYILVSGWGGSLNVAYGLADYSTTNGLPVTSNADQSTTDGQDYYLTMFGENASELIYATYFGGHSSRDHVDGGTSRFDKRGIVYQAVCASCGGVNTNDFPTTPGAWSNTDNSTNCNMGVFKMDLTRFKALASVYTTPNYCVGETVHFQNLSTGGISFLWDFGDGNTSTAFEPYHVFDTAGTYHVSLVITDSVTCILSDTDYVDIFVSPLPAFNHQQVPGFCLGDSIQLEITGADSIYWLTTHYISDTTVSNPIVFPPNTMNYSVQVSSLCGIDTLTTLVEVYQPFFSVMPDDTICRGDSIELAAYGGKGYLWSPSFSLNQTDIPNPIASPDKSTTYFVEITDINNCVWDTLLTIFVDTLLTNVEASDDAIICLGDSIPISATKGDNYAWFPAESVSDPFVSSTMAFPLTTTTFVVSSRNSCSVAYDSLTVTVNYVDAAVSGNLKVCAGEQVNLYATGGVSYWWEPSSLTTNPNSYTIAPIIYDSTIFTVDITAANGCTTQKQVTVSLYPDPYINLDESLHAGSVNSTVITPETNGITYQWNPVEGLSCSDCLTPTAFAGETTTYTFTTWSEFGCKDSKEIVVMFKGILYIPNAFTPNGDGDNDIFYAHGINIKEFEMMIFDRWGEKLFTSDDLDKGWDGSYNGNLAQTETYVWKIIYKDVLNNREELIGTVTLLR
ncbi:MAG: gliding motility-associated C-terminal domain-containing protein [Flavobacteriales bacterium]|nr:gliding motility-associated C-terminal domain-containing protein [Flavobacteriales bacterium]